jgi:Domain of unknown function (DUF5615)
VTTGAGGLSQPPRFLTDKNFNRRIITGLRRLQPTVDIVIAQDLGLDTAPDPEVLAHARSRDRILLSHDVNTITKHFNELLVSLPTGEHTPGIMLIAQDLPIGIAVRELYEVCSCSTHAEWQDRATFLPL